MENLVTLTINSTHFYLIGLPSGWLLVDAGWKLEQFTHQLKAYHIPLADIKYVMFTHHHPDHAGLIQDIKTLSGAKLIIHEKQIHYLDALWKYALKMGANQPLRVEPGDLVSPDRDRLRSIGIRGELVETPGHSADSISLVLESGLAFTGDLPLPEFTTGDQQALVRQSWQKLLARGARTFYPSHTAPLPAERIHTARS